MYKYVCGSGYRTPNVYTIYLYYVYNKMQTKCFLLPHKIVKHSSLFLLFRIDHLSEYDMWILNFHDPSENLYHHEVPCNNDDDVNDDI